MRLVDEEHTLQMTMEPKPQRYNTCRMHLLHLMLAHFVPTQAHDRYAALLLQNIWHPYIFAQLDEQVGLNRFVYRDHLIKRWLIHMEMQ